MANLDADGAERADHRLQAPCVLHVRLLCNTASTWGSALAVVPAFYGLYAGSFATPLLMESGDPAGSRLRLAVSSRGCSGSAP